MTTTHVRYETAQGEHLACMGGLSGDHLISPSWHYLDNEDADVYPAVLGFTGRRWNGWATPVVDRHALWAMARDADTWFATGMFLRADGALEIPDDDPWGEPSVAVPDADGMYDVSMGFTWDADATRSCERVRAEFSWHL